MNISRRSTVVFGIALLLTTGLTTGLVLNVDAQKDRGRLKTADLTAAAANVDLPSIVINELDADTPGTDAAEFIELKAAAGTSLNGYVLVFYSGSDDLSYFALDLDSITTDSNGLAVVGNTGVPGVDATFAGNLLQNGQDAVGLYLGDATSFPNGTPVTAANLVDAVVYDTNDADDSGLLTILLVPTGQVQINEAGAGPSDAKSVSRCSEATRDGRAFSVGLPTPNAANSNCPDGTADLNGDGRTDYLIVREGGATGVAATNSLADRLRGSKRDRVQKRAATMDNALAAGSSYQWWGLNSSDFGVFTAEWGELGDEPLVGDFDGDGKDDIAVYRPASEGSYWYSLDSSTFTLRQVHFGGEFDNPWVVGDYDGDGIDDPATFRCPELAPGTCYFFYRKSTAPNSGDWGVGWGQGQGRDVLPFPGDFNGDGLQDFAVQVQSQSNPNNGTFWVLLNGSLEYYAVEWGKLTDRLVPGDFDGDGKSDITVTRIDQNEILWWYVLEQDGGVRIVPWGNGPDFETPGDYDGDGADDIAIYRWNATDAAFWVYPSNGSSYFAVTWGQPGDTPLPYVFVQ